jgi:hypothetical protein
MYGGDDGITADVDLAKYTKACADVGQVLTAEAIMRGDRGVSFLSRMYGPDVWEGDPNSCCDIPRQLSKFHLTVKLPPGYSAQDKLREKAMSYSLTDPNTPIIGKLCATAIDVLGVNTKEDPTLAATRSWFAKFDKTVQFPNTADHWMWDYAVEALPTLDVARFEAYISRSNTAAKLLLAPLIVEPRHEPKNDAACLINGEIVEA